MRAGTTPLTELRVLIRHTLEKASPIFSNRLPGAKTAFSSVHTHLIFERMRTDKLAVFGLNGDANMKREAEQECRTALAENPQDQIGKLSTYRAYNWISQHPEEIS